MDVATTGVDGQSRPTAESPDRRLQARCDQKVAKRGSLANTSGLQLTPAAFSHTGRIHTVFKDFIREQTRQKLVRLESPAKPSKINSAFRRFTWRLDASWPLFYYYVFDSRSGRLTSTFAL